MAGQIEIRMEGRPVGELELPRVDLVGRKGATRVYGDPLHLELRNTGSTEVSDIRISPTGTGASKVMLATSRNAQTQPGQELKLKGPVKSGSAVDFYVRGALAPTDGEDAQTFSLVVEAISIS